MSVSNIDALTRLSSQSHEAVYRVFSNFEMKQVCLALSALPEDICEKLLVLETKSMGEGVIGMFRENISHMRVHSQADAIVALESVGTCAHSYLQGVSI